MRQSLLIAAGLLVLSTGIVSAQTTAARHRFHLPHLTRTVPNRTTTGKPGTANSANPAPNVPPIQTPQDPLKRP